MFISKAEPRQRGPGGGRAGARNASTALNAIIHLRTRATCKRERWEMRRVRSQLVGRRRHAASQPHQSESDTWHAASGHVGEEEGFERSSWREKRLCCANGQSKDFEDRSSAGFHPSIKIKLRQPLFFGQLVAKPWIDAGQHRKDEWCF